MNKDLDPPKNISKLYKEISSILRTARANAEFGQGYDVRELRKIRQFYLEFKNCDTLRHELTWTHYRMLLRVKDETARNWYMNEAANQIWYSWRCRLNSSDASDEFTAIISISNFKLSD